jgi:thioredoxin-like negative regulator of GroEL
VCRCRLRCRLLIFGDTPQNLAPTWEKAASELKGKVNIAKVDCTTDGFVCQLFGVRGYPTLKLYVAPSSLTCRL